MITKRKMLRHGITFLATLTLSLGATAQAKPLKIFVLAGQSNMEGHAKIETFDYIGDDPATAPLLKQMRGADGKPTVCDHVWISYLTGSGDASGEGTGTGRQPGSFCENCSFLKGCC